MLLSVKVKNMGKIFKVESGIYGHIIIRIITTVIDICAIIVNIIAGIIAIGTIAITVIIIIITVVS